MQGCMARTLSVALSTFRECTRDAVFYVALVSFTGLIFLAGQATYFGLGREAEMVREMGLATIAMGGLFLLLISGTATLASDFRTGALMAVMSKPVRRNELVLGKFSGIMLVLSAATAVLTVMFLCMLWLREGRFPFLPGNEPYGTEPFAFRALKAALLIFLELGILTGFAVFMTLLTSRPAAAVISFVAFTLGHLSGGLAAALRQSGSAAGEVAASLLPNLEFFRVTQATVEGRPPIGAGYLLLGAAYAASGAGIFLLSAMLVFRRREIQ